MKEDDFWIWGRHPVLEALRAHRVTSLIHAPGVSASPTVQEILTLAKAQRISTRAASAGEIEGLAEGGNGQGVAARIEIPRVRSVADLLRRPADRSTPPFLLILDQVQDPHNYGALLRTAECAGVQGVIVPDRRSAPLSGTVAKSSAGALSHLPIAEVSNLVRSIEELKRANVWIVGLEADAGSSLYDADLTVPLALVVGGEGSGLRRLTREHCDFRISLPMMGSIDSLNASVAGSIAMYEVVRQRTTQARAK